MSRLILTTGVVCTLNGTPSQSVVPRVSVRPAPWLNDGLFGVDAVIEFFQHELVGFMRSLEIFANVSAGKPENVVSDGNRETIKKLLPGMRSFFEGLAFQSCMDTLDRIEHFVTVETWTYGQLGELAKELRGRLDDAWKHPKLLALVDRRAQEWFAAKFLLGERVSDHFPSAAYDIEHAGRCLALDEYTACVFHLMRAAECALKSFAAEFRVKVTDASTWSAILKDIKNAIEAKPKTWKKKNGNEDYFMSLWSSADGIRAGVRNPTMHLRGKYDDKEAQHLFELTKGFMERAARRLQDSK